MGNNHNVKSELDEQIIEGIKGLSLDQKKELMDFALTLNSRCSLEPSLCHSLAD